jgi:hypothetical protein
MPRHCWGHLDQIANDRDVGGLSLLFQATAQRAHQNALVGLDPKEAALRAQHPADQASGLRLPVVIAVNCNRL